MGGERGKRGEKEERGGSLNRRASSTRDREREERE